MSLQL